MLREKYPDSFIDIAIHLDDPMLVPDYANGLKGFYTQGIPHCVMNRSSTHTGDPYYEVEKLFLKALSQGPIAKLRCTATLNDNDKVEVKAVSEFGKAIKEGLYNLAFAIVEDSVSSYSQANAYSGGNEKIGGLEDLPDPIPAGQYYFANVARAIYPSYRGDEEAFAAPTAARTEIHTLREYELPHRIDALEHVKVVAMIIDAATGQVVNVHECGLEIPDHISYKETVDKSAVKIASEGNGFLRIRTIDNSPIRSVELYTVEGRCIEKLFPTTNPYLMHVGRDNEFRIIKVTTSGGVISRKIKL